MPRLATYAPFKARRLLVVLGLALTALLLTSGLQVRAVDLTDPVVLGYRTLSNITLNGFPGTELTVASGTNVSITANWSDWHYDGYCLGCIDNVPVAFEGFGPQPAGCIENSGRHGQTGIGTVNLGNAPMTPGTYNIVAKFMFTYYCEQYWDGGSGATVIARVIVEEPDTTDPTIELVTPADGGTYTLNEVVNAAYSCADETDGSGLASCVGDVANGAPIDTSVVGSQTFTVNAADNAGNTNIATATYKVTHGICALYDQSKAHRAGSTAPIKL